MLEAEGTFRAQRISYKAGAAFPIPLLYTDLPAGDDRSSLDLTNVDLVAGLSFKLVEWASFDYRFKGPRPRPMLARSEGASSGAGIL